MKITLEKNKIYFNDADKAFANITINDTLVYLELIKVDVKFRGRSLATELMIKILEYIKTNYKDITHIALNPTPLDSNGLNLEQLIIFYEKFGFKKVKICDLYYPNLMEKKL